MNHYEIALHRLGWREITMWFRDGEYNHLEDGHASGNQPIPKHGQRWSGKWSKRIWYATDELVPKVIA